MTSTRVLDLEPKTPENADADALDNLKAAQQNLGFIPNMYANFANHPAFFDAYAYTYKLFRDKGGFNPVEQEVIFLTISRENQCKYCVGAHSFIADKMSGVPAEITDAIRAGQPLSDRRLDALSSLTAKIVQKRGFLAPADVDEFVAAGYTQAQILGVVLAVGVKTLSNYGNHLFDSELDDVFAGRAWDSAA